MKKEIGNQPLATVNDHIIRAGALSREMEQLAATIYGTRFDNLVPAQLAELRKNAITKLIREELVLESELAAAAEPDETELRAKVDEAQLGIMLQGGESLIDDEGFQQRLRETVRRELIIHHVIDLFLEEADVSDEEIQAFYRGQTERPGAGRFVRDGRLNLAEIFLAADKDLCPANRSSLILALKSFKERVEKGESFEELARKHSEREETAKQGGSIGWVRRGEIYGPAFDAACVVDDEGMTDAVSTPDGYALLRVAQKELSVLPLETVRAEISQELADTKAKAAFKMWVNQLMDKADIRVGGDPSTWGKR